MVMAMIAPAAIGCKRAPAPAELGPTRSVVVRLKRATGELSALLPAEVAKARAQGLTPYVEIGAEWCTSCKKLEASMNDPRMKDAFNGTYVIRLDADEWSSSLSELDLEPRAISVVFAVDAQGKSAGRSIDGGEWAEDKPESMAPKLKAFFATN